MRNLAVAVLVLFSIVTSNGAFKIRPKIVNGYRAEPAYFPYFAFLKVQKEHSAAACGGTLLNDRWILTAAHCLTNAKSVMVHLGETHLDLVEISHVTIPVEMANLHINPDFLNDPILNDVGLIELPQSVQFSKFIKPVNFVENCEVPEIVDAVAIGHGSIGDGLDVSSQLRFAKLKTVPLSKCQKKFSFLHGGNSVICAANKPLYQSVCHGDSGGPLVMSNDTLIGVASFVAPEGCENGDLQGFSKVLSHSKWIKDMTQLELPNC